MAAVRLFLDRAKELGVNVAATDSFGRTVLHIVSIGQLMEHMKLLLPRAKEFGIDLKQKDCQGHTFYQSACLAENKELVEYLVDQADEYGLEINPKDENGRVWVDAIEDFGELEPDEKEEKEEFIVFLKDLIRKKAKK